MTNGNWINIEKQEPEFMEEVLVWYKYYSHRKGRNTYDYGIATYANPVYQKLHGNGFVFEMNTGTERVLYWQRLPERPNA